MTSLRWSKLRFDMKEETSIQNEPTEKKMRRTNRNETRMFIRTIPLKDNETRILQNDTSQFTQRQRYLSSKQIFIHYQDDILLREHQSSSSNKMEINLFVVHQD